MLGMGEYPSGMLVPECYKSTYIKLEGLFAKLKSANTKKIATILATADTGKTVFGLFTIHKLLIEGETVMYYHGGLRNHFLFGPEESDVFKAARQHGFIIPRPSETNFIGRIKARTRRVLVCNW